jgi:DNA-directed RNA polymerase subunit L
LNPGESLQLTCVLEKALSGDDGRFKVAPVCHFKGVADPGAAAKAYDELPEETKTPEYKKNWDLLYSHHYIVPNSYIFTIDCNQNCGYSNESAVVTACDILLESLANAKLLKVTVREEEEAQAEVVVSEDVVGYLLENEIFGKPGVEFVKYGKRHPHDPVGVLRLKLSSAEVDVNELIQTCIEPLRRFYLSVASGPGKRTLHPTLQKAFDAFKRADVSEKRERLVELGVDAARAQSAPEEDLDTMAQGWLNQTERRAIPSLLSEDVVENQESKADYADKPSSEKDA